MAVTAFRGLVPGRVIFSLLRRLGLAEVWSWECFDRGTADRASSGAFRTHAVSGSLLPFKFFEVPCEVMVRPAIKVKPATGNWGRRR